MSLPAQTLKRHTGLLPQKITLRTVQRGVTKGSIGTLSVSAMLTNCVEIGIHTVEALEGHTQRFWPRSVTRQWTDQMMTTASLTTVQYMVTIYQTVTVPLNVSLPLATRSVTALSHKLET